MLHVPSLKCPYTSWDVLTNPRRSLGHPELLHAVYPKSEVLIRMVEKAKQMNWIFVAIQPC